RRARARLAAQTGARLTRGHAAGVGPQEPLPRLLGERAVAEAPLTQTDLQKSVGHLGAAGDRADERFEVRERSAVVLQLEEGVRDQELCALTERVVGVRADQVVEDENGRIELLRPKLLDAHAVEILRRRRRRRS